MVLEVSYFFLELFRPASSIEPALDFNYEKYVRNADAFGDHNEEIRKKKSTK